jgi:hypothetical protein
MANRFTYSTGFSYESDGERHEVKGTDVSGDDWRDTESKARKASQNMAREFLQSHPNVNQKSVKFLVSKIHDETLPKNAQEITPDNKHWYFR